MSVSVQTPTFSERCKVAQDCLPVSPYRTQLTALHAELLVALYAQCKLAADRLAQMQADRKQALVWRDQAARQPLTDPQIAKLLEKTFADVTLQPDDLALIRAVEMAHWIGGKP